MNPMSMTWPGICFASQIVTLAMMAIIASGIVQDANQVWGDGHCELPVLSVTFLKTIGAAGVAIVGLVSALLILLVSFLPNKNMAGIIASLITLAGVVFLLMVFLWAHLAMQAIALKANAAVSESDPSQEVTKNQ